MKEMHYCGHEVHKLDIKVDNLIKSLIHVILSPHEILDVLLEYGSFLIISLKTNSQSHLRVIPISFGIVPIFNFLLRRGSDSIKVCIANSKLGILPSMGLNFKGVRNMGGYWAKMAILRSIILPPCVQVESLIGPRKIFLD